MSSEMRDLIETLIRILKFAVSQLERMVKQA